MLPTTRRGLRVGAEGRAQCDSTALSESTIKEGHVLTSNDELVWVGFSVRAHEVADHHKHKLCAVRQFVFDFELFGVKFVGAHVMARFETFRLRT